MELSDQLAVMLAFFEPFDVSMVMFAIVYFGKRWSHVDLFVACVKCPISHKLIKTVKQPVFLCRSKTW